MLLEKEMKVLPNIQDHEPNYVLNLIHKVKKKTPFSNCSYSGIGMHIKLIKYGN